MHVKIIFLLKHASCRQNQIFFFDGTSSDLWYKWSFVKDTIGILLLPAIQWDAFASLHAVAEFC